MSLDLEAIKARCEAATPGPWAVANIAPGWAEDENDWCVVPGVVESCGSDMCGPVVRSADAAFIASARTDVPALVAEVERLREERDDLIRTLNGIPAGPSVRDVEAAYYAGRDGA